MIVQGTEGCSCGFLLEAVMAGSAMLSFVDLAKSPMEQHLLLLELVKSWTNLLDLKPLTLEEWFKKGHGIMVDAIDKHGVWILEHESRGKLHLWSPAPAVADVAMEELLKAWH